jgi:hypothetical protein
VRQGGRPFDRLAVVVGRAGTRQGLNEMLTLDPNDPELLTRATRIENGQISRFTAAYHE